MEIQAGDKTEERIKIETNPEINEINQPQSPTITAASKTKSKAFSYFKRKSKLNEPEGVCEPIDELKRLYKEHILPLEIDFKYSAFFSPTLTDTDFDAKPIVLCVGQYSTGKTTFVKYLLERDFPGMRIGPEPTTDRFIAVMQGENEKLIPGNAAAAQTDKPFSALKNFGMAFLNKFECAELESPILDKISLVDTPGILAGSEQRKERAYDFSEVIKWFAERADRILLFFDANKLDISDEMKQAIKAFKGNEDKVMYILNKADSVDSQQLMRVFGALMWSLGKVSKTPEVPRIYVGSFWNRPCSNADMAHLFEAEELDLLADLRGLPRNSVVRKINELMKRAKNVKMHCQIISHLRGQIGTFAKTKKQKNLLERLEEEMDEISIKYSLPRVDFPGVKDYREKLSKFQLKDFKKPKKNFLEKVDQILTFDIPGLLTDLRRTRSEFSDVPKGSNPFEGEENKNPDEGDREDGEEYYMQRDWVISGSLKSKFDNLFDRISRKGENIPASKAKELLSRTNLLASELKKIWALSDIDKDYALDREEFAVCMYLVDLFKQGKGNKFGTRLPVSYIPPSKRSN